MGLMDKLIEEAQHEQRGAALLRQLWDAVGPYWRDPVPEELKRQIDDYFGFDDSE